MAATRGLRVTARRVGRGGATLLVFVLGVSSMVLVHELSHTIVARAAGDPTASFHLYERHANGGFCIGCNTMDLARISAPALALVSVAGSW